MLHAQNFSYIQIWYTHPFVYRVYVYMTNFEREAYNKRTTQYDFLSNSVRHMHPIKPKGLSLGLGFQFVEY